jgi:hypothetical protein
LRRDGWEISDDVWEVAWNAVCLRVWRRRRVAAIDFSGEPLEYLLAAAKSHLRCGQRPPVRRGLKRRPPVGRGLNPRRRRRPR